ncbi:Ig-like domain-containing protein, partial [Halogeometricum limi]
ATANADGTVTYRHDGSATTGDSFTYRVSDTAGQESNTARVSVTVRSDGDTGTGGSSDVPVSNGLVAHFETDSGVQRSGSAVTGWVDQSPNGNDLTARGAPTLQSGALNGEDAIRFDGNDDLLERSGLTGLPAGNSDRTVFVVTEYVDNNGGFGGVAYGRARQNKVFGLVVNDAGRLTVQGFGGGNDFPSSTQGVGAGWLTHSVVHRNGQFTQYAGGSAIGSGTHAFDTRPQVFVVGGEITPAPYTEMRVGAILVYDRALSNTERQQVESYLSQKYLGGSSGAGDGGTGGTTDAAPTANDDTAAVNAGESTTISVLGNDADDVGLDASSVRVVTGPSSGTATANADGTVTYRHDGSATTGDSFTYRVSDTAGQASNAARVSVTVLGGGDDDSGGDTGTGGSSDAPVTNGLVAHFETDSGVQRSGSAVTGWADQSPNGNDLTARGAPTLQSGALNGEDAISFDGNDDLLERSGLTGLPAGNSDRTMFVVAEYVDNNGGFGGVAYGRARQNKVFGLVVDDQGRLTVQAFGRGLDQSSSTQGVGAGLLTQSVVHRNGQFTHYADGAVIDTGAYAFDTRPQVFVVGGEITPAPYTEMRVGAILVYDRALSDSERQQVEAYLNQKYHA